MGKAALTRSAKAARFRTPTGSLFYLDTTSLAGSSSGTLAAPWKTVTDLNAAAATIVAGSTLYVKRATTISGRIFLTANGTAASPITVTPYGTGAQPHFTGSVDACLTLDGAYTILNDLDFDNGNWSGVTVHGAHCVIQNCTLRNSVTGIHVEGQYTKIYNCQVVNNNRMSVNTPSPNNDDSGAFGILLGSGGSYSEVSYCNISGHLASSYDYGWDGCAVEISGPSYCYVHHNVADGNETFTELAGTNNTGNRFEYNVITGSFASAKALVTRGFDGTFGPTLDTRFDNNSVYFTGNNSAGTIAYANVGQNILSMNRNCIKIGGTWAAQTDGPQTETSNVYVGATNFTKHATSTAADPLFVSTTDLHLQAGSPGISRKAGAYEAGPVPFASYPMSENTGTSTANASIGTAAAVNGNWTTGKYGSGLVRSATFKAATMPNTAYALAPVGMSVMCWANIPNLTQDYHYFVVWTDTDIAGFEINVGVPSAWFRTSSGVVQPTGAAVGSTGWHHLAAVFDAGAVFCLVDGVVVGNGWGGTTIPTTGAVNADIGGESWSSGSTAAPVDEFRIYDTALTAAQITTIMAG